MNELLRRLLLQAGLRENDLAAHLGVDPKTVRRWLNGRVPYPHNRAAIAGLLRADEADLWPGAGGTLTARFRPAELGTVYPHRQSVPRETWIRFFASARQEIAILDYSALFLAEDGGIIRVLADRGHADTVIRIALADPETPLADGNGDESISDAAPARVRRTLTLYRPVAELENAQIRLHRAALCHSIYRADDQLLVQQHAYGVPGALAPVFCLRDAGDGEMAALYRDSFERVWADARPLA